MRYADKIPYVFILEYLTGVDLTIKPMFGCYAIYLHGKLCLFLVQRDKPTIPGRVRPEEQNGIYVATTTDYAEGLKQIFKAAEFQMLKDKKVWIFLNEKSERFEQHAVRACEMIKSGDIRIGR